MIGIYKITNKKNNKSYIGQSIHCGKRLDEHCKGKSQFIDQTILVEGIENFSFEILKEVSISDLCYWEDYYILKYNTLFPNGYNKRMNCSKTVVKNIGDKIVEDEQKELHFYSVLPFPNDDLDLNNLSYSDSIYAWLLLHSEYNEKERMLYILKRSFNYSTISKELNLTRQTISKRFKVLLQEENQEGCAREGFLIEKDDKYYFRTIKQKQDINRAALIKLLKLTKDFHLDELVKIYIFLLTKFQNNQKEISYSDLFSSFGHSKGHKNIYKRYEIALNLLKNEKVIDFIQNEKERGINGQYCKTLRLIDVKVFES